MTIVTWAHLGAMAQSQVLLFSVMVCCRKCQTSKPNQVCQHFYFWEVTWLVRGGVELSGLQVDQKLEGAKNWRGKTFQYGFCCYLIPFSDIFCSILTLSRLFSSCIFTSNVPIQCKFCLNVHWKYNMHWHLQEWHPSWENNMTTGASELNEFHKKITITSEEENRLKIPESKQGWSTATYTNVYDLHHLTHLPSIHNSWADSPQRLKQTSL